MLTKQIRNIILLVILLTRWVYAQDNYPVTASAILLPTQTWSELYSSDQYLHVNLLLKDQGKTNLPVFLKIKLEKVGVVIQTKPDYIPSQPISLDFGVPVSLSGSDLRQYFNPSNLEVEGLPEDFVVRGGHLPDGFYTITVTAYEYDPVRGHRQVSNVGVGLMSIFLGLPPMITYPTEGQVFPDNYPQNILFQWLPRATASQGGTTGVVYEFKLYELAENEEPNEAVGGKQPLHSTTTQTPSFLYDNTMPAMLSGKRYAVQVQVVSIDGSTKFQNDGYSEIVSFRYGEPCTAPEDVVLSNPTNYLDRLDWTAQKAAESYEISYRESTGVWKSIISYQNQADIYIDAPYTEFKVRCNCTNNRTSDWAEATISPIAILYKTPPPPPPPPPPSIDIVLNPYGIPVSSQPDIDDDAIKTKLASINDNTKITNNPCNASARKGGATCDPPAPVTYTGNEVFPLNQGDEIFINGYSILVSSGNSAKGEGLLFFPYLMTRIPVEWVGLTIRKGETATPQYGCITAGQVKAQGSQDGVLTDDLKRQVMQLLTQPGQYTGKFGEGVKKITEIGSKLPQNPPNWGDTKAVIDATKDGFDKWKQKTTDYFNETQGSVPSNVQSILTEMRDISTKLATLSACVVQKIPAGGGGNSSQKLLNEAFFACDLTEADIAFMKELEGKYEGLKESLSNIMGYEVDVYDGKTISGNCGTNTGNASFMGSLTYQDLMARKSSGNPVKIRIIENGATVATIDGKSFGTGTNKDLYFEYKQESYWRINGVMVYEGVLSSVGCYSFLDEATNEWKLFQPQGYPTENMAEVVRRLSPGMNKFATFVEGMTWSIAGLGLGVAAGATYTVTEFVGMLAVDGLMIGINVERDEIASMEGGPEFLVAYDVLCVALVAYQAGRLGTAGLSKLIDEFEALAGRFVNTKFGKYVTKLRAKVRGAVDGEKLLSLFKARLISRIESNTGFTLNHTDIEIASIISKGKSLGLSDEIIDDMLFISCRDVKPIASSELRYQMDNWVNIISKRGYPYKFEDLAQFNQFSTELKTGLQSIGVSIEDVRIQGSSLRTPNANDVDLAAIINEMEFNSFLTNRFSNRITKNGVSINLTGKTQAELIDIANDVISNASLYNNQAQSFSKAMLERKVSAYSNDKIVPGAKELYNQMKANYPNLNIENITIQTQGGNFDLKPYIKL